MKFNIIGKAGAKCTIESEDHSKRLIRDASHLKKVPSKKAKSEEFDKEEGENVIDLQTSTASIVTDSEKTRKGRVIKPPRSRKIM